MKIYYFRGKPCCRCAHRWLTVYEKLLIACGVIRESLDVYQLIGGYVGSAGTHRPGGAHDLAQRSPEAIRIAREMGCMAHDRPTNWDGKGGIGHQHGVLIGCPHNAGGRYQVAAGMRGYNGLGSGGLGGPITGHIPKTWRTWRTGIRWARKELKRRRPRRITVLNWNVKAGRSIEDVMGPLRAAAKKHKPDVITTQEFRAHAGRAIPGYVYQGEDRRKEKDGRVSAHGSNGIYLRRRHELERKAIAKMTKPWKHDRPQDPRRFPLVVFKKGGTWRIGSMHRPTARHPGNKAAIDEVIGWAKAWLASAPKTASALVGDWNQPGAPDGVHARVVGVDGVWSTGCKVVKATPLGKHGSDHTMTLYTLETL